MSIVCIFEKVLYAFKTASGDELSDFFHLCDDVEFLSDFYDEQKEQINSFFGTFSEMEFLSQIRIEADQFEQRLEELIGQGQLDTMFRPLKNQEFREANLGRKKAKGSRWLRLYAIKVEDRCYIITGGAIKTTLEMKDQKMTNNELSKFERYRSFLVEEGIHDREGIIEISL